MPEAVARRRGRDRARVCQLVVEDLESDVVRVSGPEGRHLASSLRARPGDTIEATDGRGMRAVLEVREARGSGAVLEVRERSRQTPPGRRWWLAIAASGPRVDWLVEKAVEMGAWGLVHWSGPPEPRVARWERLARAALGQCFGAWRLAIRTTLGLGALVGACPDGGSWAGIVVADPLGAPAATVPAREFPEGNILLLVGPPEGFSPRDAERLARQTGVTRLALGSQRLRSETAALALLAWGLLTDDRELQTGKKGLGKG